MSQLVPFYILHEDISFTMSDASHASHASQQIFFV